VATLLAYWQSLASDLGDEWMPLTATSSTTASEIVCSALIDSSVGTDRYAHHYAYALDGDLKGQQRIVTRNGFDPDRGALTLSRAFGSAPAADSEWALLKTFPVIRQDKTPGLREFINHALRDIAVHDFIQVTAVADRLRYTLPSSTHWWITERGRIVGLWAPYTATGDRRRMDARVDRIIYDGEDVVLQLTSPYAAGDVFELEVKRPANSRLKLGGTWQDQGSPVAGLTLDTDESMAPMATVVNVALANAYEAIVAQPGLAEARGYWEGKLSEQRGVAALLKFAEQPPAPPSFPFRMTGGVDMGAFR
jgi:hypothetical protein